LDGGADGGTDGLPWMAAPIVREKGEARRRAERGRSGGEWVRAKGRAREILTETRERRAERIGR